MSKSRYINTKFWSDTYVDTLDPSEKLLFLYLLTNERTTISGAYELPLKIMAVETGFDKNMIEKIIKRFIDDGKMIHENGWIVMLNSYKHQNLKNSKIVSGIQREFNELPQNIKVKLQSMMSHTSVIDDSSHLNLNFNLNSNLKGVEETSPKPPKKKEFKFSKEDIKLANLFAEKVEVNFPMFKEKKDINKWADDIRLIRERDGMSLEQIEFLICWVQGGEFKGNKFQEHSFWSANARSPKGLRKNKGQIMAQIQNKYKVDKGILSENGKKIPEVIM